MNMFSTLIPIVFYINLKHRIDRAKLFRTNFTNDKPIIKRVDAIYIKENGALGCLQSHIKALTLALKYYSDENHILICEDDFYIKNMKYCEFMLNKLFKSNIDWNVVMLSHNTAYLDNTIYKNIIKINDSQTASGYLIKTNYIPKLLEIYKKDLEYYNKTKIWKSEYCNDQSWKKLQKIDNWYSFLPRVAIQRPSYSDIVKSNVDYKV